MSNATHARHLLRTTGVIVAGTMSVAACGGGVTLGPDDDASDQRSAISILDDMGIDLDEIADVDDDLAQDPAENGVLTTSPPPVTQTWDTDVTGWWNGWTITVDSVEATSDGTFSSIVVSLTVVNHRDEVRALHSGDYALELDGAVAEPGFFSDPPQVAADGTTAYDLDFNLRGEFEVDRAQFVFGRPSENQAIIPLGGEPVQAFEPVELDVAGDLSTDALLAEVTGPAHVAPSFESGDRGRYVVRIPLLVAYTGEASGGTAVMPTQFVLEAPDGTSAVGEPLARGDIIAEPLPRGGAPQPFSIAFRTGEPQTGTYRVILDDPDGATATATFEMPDFG